ncbi:MAG: NAD(P)-binding domain-containing protein [Candidatus Methanomethylicia archaeon]|nr:NAD(P)-binding domain-containing protein [Candidatus Methanomethylicia archaeon]
MRIGFIGLGIMGLPMAKNLIKAGHSLAVYNRSRRPVDEMVALGAKGCSSSKEVASLSDFVITMLPDSPDVKDVVLGPSGVIEGLKPGTTLIDMSTISPKVSIAIALEIEKRSCEMLDAPVSGGQKGAVDGTLSIMVGGKKEVYERALPILKSLGRVIVHVGDHGAGETVKLCNQVICAINIVSMCEGMALCKKSGVDIEKMIQVVSGGLGASNIISSLAPKILQGDMEPGFKLKLQQKDLRLALELAESLKLPLVATGLAHQVFRIAESKDLGDKGTQALFKAYELMG